MNLFRLGLGLVMLGLMVQECRAEAKVIKPVREWTGVVNNSKLANAAPKSAVILDRTAFEALWRVWR